jgi:hypothetical protein
MPAHGTSFRRYLNMTDLKELNASGSKPVFAADVEGYSRLVGADEVGTLKGVRLPRDESKNLRTFVGRFSFDLSAWLSLPSFS